jgi:glucose/mannose-6-phosphate isomerase
MHPLDERSYVERLDPSGMLRLTEDFPGQCRQALAIARASALPSLDATPSCVVLTGLGGSAAGGDFVRALFEAGGACPFLVNRDYSLPAFVDSTSLVFAVSYSGNTEETLAAYDDAKSRGARVVCVTTGGKLGALALQNGDALITVPGGQPPRTALGFMFVPVVHACASMRLIGTPDYDGAFDLLDNCVNNWTISIPFEQNGPKQLAVALHGRLAVLYGLGPWQAAVANRWKGQINENAKVMTFANAFPELCHNEILGWVAAGSQGVASWVGVVLEDGHESSKMKKRAEVTASLVGELASFHHVRAVGGTLFEKMLSLVLYGDFVSLYMAVLNGVDPENIDSINVLKSELAQVD